MDPWADKFPAWTPYHFVHGNPVMLYDPNGMEAYPPEEGNFYNGQEWNDSDGTWRYNEANKEWMTVGGENGNMLYIPEVEVTGERRQIPSISQKNYNTNDIRHWNRSSSTIKQFAYAQLNSIYLAIQVVDFDLLYDDQHENPFRGGSYHNLDGGSHYDDVTLDFVSNASLITPSVKLLPGHALNAAQFSSKFKGTIVARSSPQLRGYMNRGYNNAINFSVDPINSVVMPAAQSIKPMVEID